MWSGNEAMSAIIPKNIAEQSYTRPPVSEHCPRRLMILGCGSMCLMISSSESRSSLSEGLALAAHINRSETTCLLGKCNMDYYQLAIKRLVLPV